MAFINPLISKGLKLVKSERKDNTDLQVENT